MLESESATTTDASGLSGIQSIPGIVYVEVLRGALADEGATPDLLVEVPHGADELLHYDHVRAQMTGALPAGLEEFFFFNTDIGAWAYGVGTAERVLRARPKSTAILLRSLIPRTLIDCNRPADFEGGALKQGGLTAGIPSYVQSETDRALLCRLHASYVATARAAYAFVCGSGGFALVPHTYGPRSVGIERVDAHIVENLRAACEGAREGSWPLRPEIDLLTRDGAGNLLCAAGLEDRLLAAFASGGYAPKANQTYQLVPGSLGYDWSIAYPGRVLCLEVRRDLVVDEWLALRAMTVAKAKVARVADVLAAAIVEP
jgi:hypothetical protein